MKNRLNNKGFAVSTVVYAILILLVIFMFTILLLYRNAYRNQKDFNDEVKEELNDYLIDEFTPEDKNAPSCTLTAEEKVDDTYILTINSSSEDLEKNSAYSFDNVNYSYETTKTVSSCGSNNCTYSAWVRDKAGNVSDACKVTIVFDNTPPSCTLSYSSSNIIVSSSDTDLADKPFSFDGSNYDSVDSKATSTTGTYTVYVKDKSDNVGQCSITLTQYTATFYLTSFYSNRITSPTSTTTRSCISKEGSSCNITTPNLTVSSTTSYTYTAKGWSTTQNATSAAVSKNANLSISSNISYYPTISRTRKSSSGGSSGDSSSDCSVGIRSCSYTDGKCTSCETGNSKGECISCSCPC